MEILLDGDKNLPTRGNNSVLKISQAWISRQEHT